MADAMIDLGKPSPIKGDGDIRPSLYLSGLDDQLELPDGDFYAVVVCCKKGYSMNESETGDQKHSYTLEVQAIKPIGKVEDEDEEILESNAETAVESIMNDIKKLRSGGSVDDETNEGE